MTQGGQGIELAKLPRRQLTQTTELLMNFYN